jgi:acetyl-CoA acetyltransferase family protein
MTQAFVCDAVRTPIGRFGGALAPVRTDDLAAHPIKALMARNPGVDWAALDDVVYGCANQAGEDNRNVARMAGLIAGLPVSSQAARAIRCGEAALVLAGGVESMSRAPFVMAKAEAAFSRKAEVYDTTLGWRFINPVIERAHGVDAMAETAENVAEEHQIAREDQDRFALWSQQKTGRAQANGRLAKEIAAVAIPRRRGEPILVEHDEHPRPETTLEALAKLPARFRKEGGRVTAGNASGVNDGAAALLVASEQAAKEQGLTPPRPSPPRCSRSCASWASPTTTRGSTPTAAPSPSAIPWAQAARA